jgi:hypothetical protein
MAEIIMSDAMGRPTNGPDAFRSNTTTRKPTTLDKILAWSPIPVVGEWKAHQVAKYDLEINARPDPHVIFSTEGPRMDSLVFNIGPKRLVGYLPLIVLAAKYL